MYIGKYLLMEKMAFLLMPNIYLHEAQISWKDIFSVSCHGISLNIKIFITMKKKVVEK